MNFPKIQWRTPHRYWRWPLYVTVWGSVALVAVLVIVGGAVAYTHWEDGRNQARGLADAPALKGDDSPAKVINFPDRFANIAVKCLGETGIYTSTRPAPPVIILHDPYCVALEGES